MRIEVTQNLIKSAIATRIKEYIPEITLYFEPIDKNLKFPCIFIDEILVQEIKRMNNDYLRQCDYELRIVIDSKETNQNAKMGELSLKCLNALNYIHLPIEQDDMGNITKLMPYKSFKPEVKNTDERTVKLIYVTYKINVEREEPPVPKMRELDIIFKEEE